MIIFLYGSESYFRFHKQKEIVKQYQLKHSHLSVDRFDLSEDDEGMCFKDFVSAVSLFDSFKLAVVNSPLQSELKELFKKNLTSKELILLLISESKPNKEFDFLLKKPVIFQEFSPLEGKEWQEFVDLEIKKRDLKLRPEILSSIINEYAGNCWGLVTELEKLALCNFLAPLGRGSPNFIGRQLKYDFFSMINKLSRGNFVNKVPILETLMNDEDPAKIFNVLAFAASPENKKILADYDIAIKSGKLDYETALTDFAIR